MNLSLLESLLLLGCGLLGSLLSGLLSGGLLGGLGLSSLLGGGLLSGLRLLDLLGSGLLGSLGLLGLLSLGLLGLRLLGGKLEGSGSLLAGSGGRDDLLGGDHLPEGELDADTGLGGVDLVVGHDVLEDGLPGGALLVREPLDGGSDHAGVGRVGGRLGDLLGLDGLGGGGGHGEGAVDSGQVV